MNLLRCFFLVSATVFSSVVSAEIKSMATLVGTDAAPFVGSEYRPDVDSAVALMQQKDNVSAWSKLRPALDFCDTKMSSAKVTYVSVATQAEASEFVSDHADESSIVVIDIACPMAYTQAAFLMVEANEPTKAFAFLDRAHTLAPYWAEPLAERGYLFRAQGDNANSLATYQIALDLATRYESSGYMRALILRGIGFVQTELGQFKDARSSYEKSLLVEPSNELAKHEIEYIDKMAANDQ